MSSSSEYSDSDASSSVEDSSYASGSDSDDSSSTQVMLPPVDYLTYRKGKEPQDVPVIQILNASQYCAKVLAALDSKQLKYYVEFVPPTKLKKHLPPPYTVPVLKWNGKQITDSGAILKHFDRALTDDGKPFMPNDDYITELEEWIGDVLNYYVWYFNWVDDEGFDRSISHKVREAVPCFLKCIPPARIVKGRREAMMRRIEKNPKVTCGDLKSAQKGLRKALRHLNTLLEDSDTEYLSGYPHPTAPDFGAYALVARFIDYTGDSRLGPCYPSAVKDAKAPALQEFYDMMRERYPIKFRGKRKPKK